MKNVFKPSAARLSLAAAALALAAPWGAAIQAKRLGRYRLIRWRPGA